MASATIKIFLVHGDPKRLRTAELSNWTGKAVAGPRSEFDGITTREESSHSGIYLLTGIDPESGDAAIYIGEAESIRDRLKAHLVKDFWNQVIFFISKDENLTKAHVRYLEGKLIQQAQQAGRALVVNGQASGAKLPESDREDMEVFLEKVNQLLPVLGVELLVSVNPVEIKSNNSSLLECVIKGLKAQGYRTSNGFLVLEGSQAVLVDRASSEKYPWARNMREKLKADGVMAPEANHLRFSRDFEFSSPSAAAAVIHGGHANGLLVWKNNLGQTLKAVETG